MHLAAISPPLPRPALPREHLLSRLSSWEHRKLLIVHGPAGMGKSTLAAQYVRQAGPRPLWLTVGPDTGEPAALLSALGRAVQAAFPGAFPSLPPLPKNRFGQDGTGRVVDGWVRDVLGSLSAPAIIVLDDWHLGRPASLFNGLLTKLLEATPGSVRFLLVSRTRPGLDVARLRARQQVAELTDRELRFTDEEVEELFGSVFGMPLSRTDAVALNRVAEGWPAGLVLMHEYLAASPGNGTITALASRRSPAFRRHIFDYLAQEVVSHLPADLQDFLMRTSPPDTLTPGLMAALSGLPGDAPAYRPSVRSLISELRRRNLFITIGDGAAETVRYHSLFREFLLKRFQETSPASVVQRCGRIAADDCFRRGDPVRGVTVLLDLGMAGEAVSAIEAHGPQLVARGNAHQAIEWAEALPQALADRPWFHFFRAVASRYTAPSASLALAERALAGFRRSRDLPGEMLALSALIESCFHTGGDFHRMARAAGRARVLLRMRKPAREDARLRLAVGMAWFFLGRLKDGADALRQALELFGDQGDRFSEVTSAIYLAPCALYHGDFPLARLAVRRGFSALEHLPGETGGRAGLYLIRAMTALFEGGFAEARDSLEHCGSLAEDHALGSIGFLSQTIGGWVRIAQGDLHGAVTVLERCKRESSAARHAFFCSSAGHLLAIARLFAGDLAAAEQESDEALGLAERSGSRLFHAIYLIASGAIHLRRGRIRKAERELLSAVGMLRQVQAAQQEANAHLLLALLALGQGRPAAAGRHLDAGFGTGSKRGFTYYALLRPDELAGLASAAAGMGIEEAYCRRLLAALAEAPSGKQLRVRCLGTFRVERSSGVIGERAWKGKLTRSLIKLLAAQGTRGITRDEAAEALWPGTDVDRYPRLLNGLLHRARQVLDPGSRATDGGSCILQEGDRLRLDRGRVWTDVAEFEALHAAARKTGGTLSGEEAKRVLALLDQAFSLYQGDLLPSDTAAEWLQTDRDRLRTMHADLLHRAAELAGAVLGMDAAEPYYERIFSLDPGNEQACRWLMRRYAAEGRRSDAVRIFERCELGLRNGLDMEPEEQTRQIYLRVIGGG